ncbi:VWA domain-containing protein [Fertoebacter nigrum]|uniref:VWA domain-containing protein n=1 Tax=Fertoeibacter niger TaxID=2656921 RepID=A0A8X8H2D0_9RHOB|nr:VWA domain-containing protein [Fertoeibacter niger]NUB44288.1 VWA domain-containing protein [Fertoeibacter niger]
MTDDLDALRAALRATPAPDAGAKAAALRLAMENFDRISKAGLQESTHVSRPNQDRPSRAGFLKGLQTMFDTLTSRAALAATTSVAALCLGLVVVLPLADGPQPTAPALPEIATLPQPAPEPQADAGAARSRMAAAPESEAPSADMQATDLQAAESVVVGEVAPMAAAPAPPLAKRGAPALAQDSGTGAFMPEGRTMAAPDGIAMPMPEDTEAFANADANPVKVTAEQPVSTFAIDVDTASYAIIRSSLNAGALPPPDAVRVEEMVNYFPYAYPAPAPGEAPFTTTVTVLPAPWNTGKQLVHIGLQGRLPAQDDRPPLNLVFLIDTSGSMDEANKLPLLQQSLRLMLRQLRPEDQVAIVAYAGSAGLVLEPTAASESATIMAALDRLAAGGSTAGAEGLELAYATAARMAGAGEVSRVLLATDGDFNVGLSDPAALTDYIARQRDTGIYLSVLGFGRGNLDDATMQALAQNGNGQAAYIDTLSEARKVLVDQLTGALFPIAGDVKIQVEWNPATVAEYRLIGFETRALRREDFNKDAVDAGEIGAGHSMTAIYEVTPVGSPALLNDPLRYAAETPAGDASELGFLRLRYKAPGEETSALIETPILPETGPATDDVRFGVAIAGFGQLLTGATYLGDWGWDQAIAQALAARGDDPFGYRIEAVNLMRLAQGLDGR